MSYAVRRRLDRIYVRCRGCGGLLLTWGVPLTVECVSATLEHALGHEQSCPRDREQVDVVDEVTP